MSIPFEFSFSKINEVNGEEKLVVVSEVERFYHGGIWQSATNQDSNRICQLKYRRNPKHIDPGFEIPTLQTPLDFPNFQVVVDDIRQAFTEHHGLQVHGIVLLRIGSIPKTSSGKIRRYW